MDDNAMKKLEDTLAITKFAPKTTTNLSITDLLEQWADHMKALALLHDQMKEAWGRVGQHAMDIRKEIER